MGDLQLAAERCLRHVWSSALASLRLDRGPPVWQCCSLATVHFADNRSQAQRWQCNPRPSRVVDSVPWRGGGVGKACVLGRQAPCFLLQQLALASTRVRSSTDSVRHVANQVSEPDTD